MAARGTRAGPAKGHNSLNAKEETALIGAMLAAMKEHEERKAAFSTKMKRRWETEVVAKSKILGMSMADVKACFEDHKVETGKDEDAVERAARKRSRRLDTERRIYSALHDGAQLDWVTIEAKAAEARKEAEAEAGEAVEEEDGED